MSVNVQVEEWAFAVLVVWQLASVCSVSSRQESDAKFMGDMYCAFCDVPSEALRQRMSNALHNEENVGICSRCGPRLDSVIETVALPLVRAALADPEIQDAIRSVTRARLAQMIFPVRQSD